MEMTVHIPDVWALSKTQLFAAPNIFRFSFYLVFHLFHPHWLNPDRLRRSCKEDRACSLASGSFTACTGSCVLTYPTAGHHGQRTHILSLILIMCHFCHPLSLGFGSRFTLDLLPWSPQPITRNTALRAQRSTLIPLPTSPRGAGGEQQLRYWDEKQEIFNLQQSSVNLWKGLIFDQNTFGNSHCLFMWRDGALLWFSTHWHSFFAHI